MKIALGFKDLTEADTVTLASTIISDMNLVDSINPNPPLATLTNLRNAAQQALNVAAAARQALTVAITTKTPRSTPCATP